MTMNDLPGLSDAGLIDLIEEAQRLLDERHNLNPGGLRCPRCGQSEHLRLEAYQWADWEPDGTSPDTDCDPAWGAESACNCPECEYEGRVLDFLAQEGPANKP